MTSHLSGILFRTANFLEKGIKTVFVFDGKPPEPQGGHDRGAQESRDEAGENWKEAVERGDEEEAYKQARSSTRVDETVIATSKELVG